MNYELIFHTLIVSLTLGSYIYINHSVGKVYKYINNHLTQRIKEVLKEELKK